MIDRRQPDRVLEQLGRGLGRAATYRKRRGPFDLGRDTLVARVGAEREVHRPLLQIGRDASQAQMQLLPLPRRDARIVHGRKQRMREPDALTGDFDHTGSDGLVEISNVELVKRGAEQRDRRIGERRNAKQRRLHAGAHVAPGVARSRRKASSG